MANSKLRNPNVFVQAATALQVAKGQLNLDTSIPQFALVGMQSAGKTRMLCALSRRKIGGAEKAETGTRCPVIYHFEIADGDECCKIGTTLTTMEDIPASELHIYVTQYMGRLEKVGFSEEPLYIHIKGNSSLNARIVDLPGLKPPGSGNSKNSNKQIGRIIKKYVSELGYTPLVMSGFNEKMDMDYVSSELDSVLQQFDNREQTAKNSIIFVSRLDFARQGLVQNPRKLDEYIDTAKRLNFQPSNIVFFSLMPELLDGQSHQRPGDSYEEQTEYFQDTLPAKEEELLPVFLNDMKIEKSKYLFGVKTAIDVIETKLETSFRGSFQEVIAQMREKWKHIEADAKAALPTAGPDDAKFKEIVRAYVMLITDVLSGTATCDHQRIVNSLDASFRLYPLHINRGDEKMADELIKKLSLNFEEEKEFVSSKMSLSHFAFIFDDAVKKKLKPGKKDSMHAIAKKLTQRLSAGAALHRLLSLFTFAVMERDMREFNAEDVYNMADMIDMNCKRGFSSAMVMRKMVNQLTISPLSFETIVWWSAWVYISQAVVVCQELRQYIRLLENFPELRDHLDQMLVGEYERFFKEAAKDTAGKIGEMVNVRFGTLKLDELTASIRLLGCCKLNRAMLQSETTNGATNEHALDGIPVEVKQCIVPLLSMACPVPILSPILSEAVKLGLSLYESRKHGMNAAIENTFDFFSKIAASSAHDFASFDGLKLQEIGQGDVDRRIKELNATAQMIARFNSGMALLEIVSYVERFAEKARQLNHDIKTSMTKRVNQLLDDERYASTLQRLVRGADSRRVEKMKEASNDIHWFIEVAEKINLCCPEVKCTKLDVNRAQRLLLELKAKISMHEVPTTTTSNPECDLTDDPNGQDEADTFSDGDHNFNNFDHGGNGGNPLEMEHLLLKEENKALQEKLRQLKELCRKKDREIEDLQKGILIKQEKPDIDSDNTDDEKFLSNAGYGKEWDNTSILTCSEDPNLNALNSEPSNVQSVAGDDETNDDEKGKKKRTLKWPKKK